MFRNYAYGHNLHHNVRNFKPVFQTDKINCFSEKLQRSNLIINGGPDADRTRDL